jgi:SDR family mycofactocin-dependent oxidoreductase
MGKLDGKVAFITGAARGQGRSHAVRLAEEGADIIAVDLCAQIDTIPYPMSTPDDLALTVKEVEALGRRIVATEADVRDRKALQAAFDDGVAQLGRIDIVVANAGIMPIIAGDDEDEETFDDVVGVNLKGVWNTIEVARPTLLAQGEGGSMILTASTMGVKGSARDVPCPGYTAAKHGVIGLMHNYANTLAEQSIRVNVVAPTGVNTPMAVNEPLTEVLNSPRMAGSLTNAMPVKMVEPSDVSEAVVWLAGDTARYVTGIVLPVDAGFLVK